MFQIDRMELNQFKSSDSLSGGCCITYFKLTFLQDQFDTIDLSDNEIVKLENFPYLTRLGTLLINNNRITRINPNIGGEIASLFNYIIFVLL